MAALERSSTSSTSAPAGPAHPAALPDPVAGPVPEAGIGSIIPSSLSVFGSALLGIAGAYMLRAISGASLLPRAVVAGLAAVYATAWLVAAARTVSRQLAASLFAATSILILAPMLWEMFSRFHAMSAGLAAGYVAAYAAVVTVIGIRAGPSAAYTVASSGSALIAASLSIATHSMALFSVILLAMYAVSELSPLRARSHLGRMLISLSADLSIWALLYIYSLAPGEQTDYSPVSPFVIVSAVALLFAIQVVSLIRFTVQRSQPLELFSAVQAMISFALLLFGIARFVPVHNTRAIGVICLVLALGGYTASYGPIRHAAQPRTLGVFLAWSCTLLLAAVFFLASQTVASVILGLIAVATVPLAAKLHAESIALQGILFLCAAAFASGLLMCAATALVGSTLGLPSWPVVLVAASAFLSYALAVDAPREPVLSQCLHLFQAFIAASALAAFLIRALVGGFALVVIPGAGHIAVMRTFVLCAVAAALIWLGARLGRVQMARVAYVALALAAVKLLFEDLRLGRMEFIAVSVFLVAITFITVPRLARTPALSRSHR